MIQNVDDALKVYFHTDQFKINETPTPIADQKVPPDVENNNNEFEFNFNDIHKNETINIKLKANTGDSVLNQSKSSIEKSKSAKKKKFVK